MRHSALKKSINNRKGIQLRMWLEKGTRSLERLINLLAELTNTIGGGILLLMVFFTTADVVLRYAFNRPITGSIEFTEFMMAIVAGLAVAYTAAHKGHISVELVVERFSPRAQAVINSITCLLTLGAFAVISWQSIVIAENFRLAHHVSAVWRIPIYPFMYVVAFGAAIVCLVLFVNLIDYLTQVIKGMRRRVWAWLILLMALIWVLFAAPFWGEELIWGVSPITAGIVGTVMLIVLLFSGMQVAMTMGLIGFLGMAYVNNVGAGLSIMGTSPYDTIASYTNSVVPLFVLMGCLCFYSGITKDLFRTANSWLGRLPGGLAIASIGATALFSAVSGSSTAASAAMGTVVLPEMKRYNYDPKLATGSIAAGAGLDILIPPSIVLVIYGILTEQPVGKLLVAGIIPGIVGTILFIIIIYVLCKRNPLLGPRGPSTSFREKVVSLKGTGAVLAIFIICFGGLYAGVFTPTEAAGIGAFGSLIFSLTRKGFGWRSLADSLNDTALTTGMCAIILAGGILFGYFLAVSRLPFAIADIAIGLEVNRYLILGGIIIIYLFLGCIMSALAMIIITVPIFFPVIVALGFDPIWFGIMIGVTVEMGMITPPVGMNVFVIKGVAKDIPMHTIFQGIVPFFIAYMCLAVLLIVFPQIATFLPNMMK